MIDACDSAFDFGDSFGERTRVRPLDLLFVNK